MYPSNCQRLAVSLLIVFCAGWSCAQSLRPPAYPLVTHDPYFSIWSTTDNVTDSPTRHWTGTPQSLEGVVRVDGKAYQFLGAAPTTYAPILPTAETGSYIAQYTTTKPAPGWEQPTYKTTGWSTGPGPFGDTPDARTRWRNSESDPDGIYLRREFTYDGKADPAKLLLALNHDDAVDIYLNGVQILKKSGYIHEYIYLPLSAEGQRALRKGKNVLAVHCVSPRGGSFIDVGLVLPIQAAPVTAATQINVTVTATQTKYAFTAGPLALTVTFLSPLLLDELDVAARPVTYVTCSASAQDGKPHAVQVFFSAAGTLATNTGNQDVVIQTGQVPKLAYTTVGTKEQPVLAKKGDNIRIDWGYAYLAVPQQSTANAQLTTGDPAALKKEFVSNGQLPTSSRQTMPIPARSVAMATVLNLSDGTKLVPQYLMLAYDDLYSVQYFGKNLRPWWRRNEQTTLPALLQTAAEDYDRLNQKCTLFDEQLRAETEKAGGKAYADLCVLAYRQTIAAHKIVYSGDETQPLFLSKENFSNGSIGTVDITYPSAPMFLRYNSTLLKGMMEPIFYYSESGKWPKPFAAHDVGTYPQANGQTYGEDMPVEESGNMLLLTAAIAGAEGNAGYARQHWKTLTTWVEYLSKAGFDPENQLCTDDFAGHLARNANLSVKAILGIAAYGQLAAKLGDNAAAQQYQSMAQDMAAKWQQLALDRTASPATHYDLTFENPADSWSQKYNLVWDKLLNLNIFPKTVAQREIAYYLTKQQPYGLPLDSRKTYTKSDWIVWTATLADSDADFRALIQPIWRYANETPSRVPLSDWHETTNAKQVGFQARSVIGGYYIKLLEGRLSGLRTK
ncbi:glutaminase family protein [Spirosoma fluminis]